MLPLVANRYQLLHPLGHGGMGIVYTAQDRLTGEIIALKQVQVPEHKLDFASKASTDDDEHLRLGLAQEFRTLATLRHPHIISVLDYGFDAERQPFFTMPLLQKALSITAYASERDRPTRLRLLAELLEALAYLHRHGTIHRDLKPDNVLVDTDGRVKVMDFGLALSQEESQDEDSLVGTFGYLAPELLLGGTASIQSDLFAAGVIGYELLLGKHPFDTSSITRLLHTMTTSVPDLTMLDLDLSDVLENLLAHTTSQRYTSADDALAALRTAMGQDQQPQDQAVRESYLQASRFVGRDTELAELLVAYDSTIRGLPQHWLVGGESGVGKSRLIEEFRMHVLVQGARVLRGQGIAEGGAPYQIWREAARALVLRTTPSALDAAVLKALIPDISDLLERDVPDAPEIDAQGAHSRLVSTLVNLFRQPGAPLVLLLEDLQWAEESLSILKQLIQNSAGFPLMIVGTYRDDERPELPKILPGLQVMPLARLERDAVRTLADTMLGGSGVLPGVVDLLERETEGNVFFIIEVVRALAEEAGQLAQVGQMTLPPRVAAGGIRAVLQRRLERVPAAAQPLLKAAAVAGREVDLNVLRLLAPEISLENWLAQVGSVMTVQDNRYRFAHDKLRESVLAGLSAEERTALHVRIATALETAYGDGPEFAAALAYHWSEAGVAGKAMTALEKAGGYAIVNGAYQGGIDTFTRALQFHAQEPVGKRRVAHWHEQISEGYTGLGNTRKAREHALIAAKLLGVPLPPSIPGLIAGLLWESAVQLGHRLLPKALYERKRDQSEAVRAYERILQANYYSNRLPESLYAVVRALNLAEGSRETTAQRARALANLGLMFGLVPLHAIARFYLKHANDAVTQTDDPLIRSWVFQVNSLYDLAVANWEHLPVEKALELARQVGDRRRLAELSVLSTWPVVMRGRYNDAEDRYSMARQLAEAIGDKQTLLWATQGLALARIQQGESIGVNALLGDEPRNGWLLAILRMRMDDFTGAEQALEPLVKRMKHRPLQVYQFDVYALTAEVRLRILEADPTPERWTAAETACRTLKTYGDIFPITKPRALIWSGLLAWLKDKPDAARAQWSRALALAETMGLPYDVALAQYELGRHGDKDALRRAEDGFARLGAGWEIRQTQEVRMVEV